MFEPATDDSARIVVHTARDALSQGRIAEAMDAVERARPDLGLTDGQRASLHLTGLMGKLALGDLRGAAAYARELTNLMRVRGPVGAMASYGLGEFAAARSNADQAVSYFERAGQELASSRSPARPTRFAPLPWRSGLARVLAGRGEVTAAAALVEAELADARATGTPYDIASALRTYAAIAATNHRVGLLEEALEVLDGYAAARLDAQIRTDLAGWLLLLHPGESARAIDLLRSAEKYARHEELTPLLSRIRWLLERLGEAPDGELPGRLAELSAAERRVAQLIIVGKRNREIAAELGVSVKSVEWHVSHILRKLSITSRHELADALSGPRQPR
jgi:DNA-binding NarL/FixJ family response regulator